MFEDDVYVDLSGVLDGKPDYANVPFSKIFSRARCPSVLAPSCVAVVKVYG